MASSKLSPATKLLMTQAKESSQVDAILRCAGSLTDSQRGELEAAGARIRSTASDVLTAEIPVASLDRIADLDFVLYIDISRPLYPED